MPILIAARNQPQHSGLTMHTSRWQLLLLSSESIHMHIFELAGSELGRCPSMGLKCLQAVEGL